MTAEPFSYEYSICSCKLELLNPPI